MPRGDKSKYTDKQERKAGHIAESYESRSVPEKEAERRAWATVNKDDAGGKAPGGSGRGKSTRHPPRTEEAGSAAPLRPLDRAPIDRPRRERRRPQGSGTPSAAQRDSRLEESGRRSTPVDSRNRLFSVAR